MISEQKILEIYEAENGSVAATARRAGINYQVVCRILITNGIIPPGKPKKWRSLPKKAIAEQKLRRN